MSRFLFSPYADSLGMYLFFATEDGGLGSGEGTCGGWFTLKAGLLTWDSCFSSSDTLLVRAAIRPSDAAEWVRAGDMAADDQIITCVILQLASRDRKFNIQ